MKKIISLLLALAVTASLCSCGSRETANNGEPVTITWLMYGDKQTDQASVMEKVNEITVPAINAKLDIQYIDMGSYQERMKMNMASGSSAYDMCFVGWNNPYIAAAENGSLYDITDMLDEHKTLKESIPDYFWEGSTYEGKIYAVPNVQVAATSMGVFVKKDLADEYGLNLDEIRYINDMEPFLKWVKENHPEVYPFRTGQLGAFKDVEESYDIGVSGCSAIIDRDTGKVTVKPSYAVNNIAKFELLRDWYNKGYIRKDNAVATDDNQEYNAGKFACWMLTYKPGVEAEIYTSKGYEAYAKQLTEPYQAGLIGSNTMIGINAKSPNPEKALEMIELIQTNKELYNLICFGIEGKHYTVENDRIVQDNQSGYMPTMSWRFGNQFNAKLIEGQPDGVWEATEKFNDEAYKTPLLGFVFDSSKVRTEIAQIGTTGSKYSGMLKGTEDISGDFFERNKNEMIQAGVDKVAEEAQRQVDEFLKNK